MPEKINETYANLIAMLCASKTFRTYESSYHYFSEPSGNRQIVSDLLFEQKFAPNGIGMNPAKFLTNHETESVTVFLNDQQQEFWNLKRIDLRGAPGTGKTLLIMLKILERSNAPI